MARIFNIHYSIEVKHNKDDKFLHDTEISDIFLNQLNLRSPFMNIYT